MSYPIDDLERLIFEMLERLDRIEARIGLYERERVAKEAPMVLPRGEVEAIFGLIDRNAQFNDRERKFINSMAEQAGLRKSQNGEITAKRRLVLSPKQWTWLKLLRVKYPRPAPATPTAEELQEIPDNMLN